MRRWIAVLTLLLLAGSAYAGSYTVTTTPDQDEALKVMAERAHARRQASGHPPGPVPTAQELVQTIVNNQTSVAVSDLKRSAQKQAACAKVTDAQAKQTLGCPASPK